MRVTRGVRRLITCYFQEIWKTIQFVFRTMLSGSCYVVMSWIFTTHCNLIRWQCTFWSATSLRRLGLFPGAHAGVSTAKKGIQSLISYTFQEGNRTADILASLDWNNRYSDLQSISRFAGHRDYCFAFTWFIVNSL